MKFRNKKLVGLFTAGSMIMAMSIQALAATSGISAGISETIAANIESGADANAGVSSALASCIDVSTAKLQFLQEKMRQQPPDRVPADIRIWVLPK